MLGWIQQRNAQREVAVMLRTTGTSGSTTMKSSLGHFLGFFGIFRGIFRFMGILGNSWGFVEIFLFFRIFKIFMVRIFRIIVFVFLVHKSVREVQHLKSIF